MPEVDYLIDLSTGETTPLPRAILRSHRTGRTHFPPPGQYAASPDGSRLAYRGKGEDGSLQIFIAGIDGTGVRQVTHDPVGAVTPAWSPDGSTIAYQRRGSGEDGNIHVLDVATAESTQVTDEPRPCRVCYLQPVFTPDGSS
ncbi:MAG TPA: hypothetical protein VM778_11870, partial [Gemmatimonadota bacterium]|nr:hypothetical protein [Gemmatimonadota bacterium]